METFTIRVYGIASQQDKILLAVEEHEGTLYHKFPGGGLEFGEGIVDTLRRELREEAALEIEIISHVYTLDYFMRSQFINDCQIIAVYYNIGLLSKIAIQEAGIEYYWLAKEEVLKRLSFATDKTAFKTFMATA